MSNEIMNSVMEMSIEQKDALMQQLMLDKMQSFQERIEKLESQQQYHNKQNELKYNDMKNDVDEVKDNVTDIKEKLHILAVEPGKLQELRNTVKKKIAKLCNGLKTDEYVLFSKLFYAKCQSHLTLSLNVTRYDQIRVDDFEVALTIIKRWQPKHKDVSEKLSEYVQLDSEGQLLGNKKLALDKFLDKTEGGTRLSW